LLGVAFFTVVLAFLGFSAAAFFFFLPSLEALPLSLPLLLDELLLDPLEELPLPLLLSESLSLSLLLLLLSSFLADVLLLGVASDFLVGVLAAFFADAGDVLAAAGFEPSVFTGVFFSEVRGRSSSSAGLAAGFLSELSGASSSSAGFSLFTVGVDEAAVAGLAAAGLADVATGVVVAAFFSPSAGACFGVLLPASGFLSVGLGARAVTFEFICSGFLTGVPELAGLVEAAFAVADDASADFLSSGFGFGFGFNAARGLSSSSSAAFGFGSFAASVVDFLMPPFASVAVGAGFAGSVFGFAASGATTLGFFCCTNGASSSSDIAN
jgi:hypothetical protein